MIKHIRIYLLVLLTAIVAMSWTLYQTNKPAIYLIGDSTVKNGKGKGDGGLWGWGNFLATFFDTTKITVENDALGGTSSRTFQTQGLWDKVLAKIKPGDYVIMQFGHNDGSPLADTARARGTIKGIGTESQEVYNPIRKVQEVVHTYGWYMRKFIEDAKAKGATALVCSPIPRNNWNNGKINRDTTSYGLWSKQVAAEENVYFINLNHIICNHYDDLGEEKASNNMYTKTDHTHTSLEGAKLNAACVVEGIREIKDCPLNAFILPDADKKTKK